MSQHCIVYPANAVRVALLRACDLTSMQVMRVHGHVFHATWIIYVCTVDYSRMLALRNNMLGRGAYAIRMPGVQALPISNRPKFFIAIKRMMLGRVAIEARTYCQVTGTGLVLRPARPVARR